MLLKVKKLGSNGTLPTYGSAEAAGFDIYAAEDVKFPPGRIHAVKTDIAMEIPKGFEVQIRPRSGLSFKTGLIIKNSPGTIDSDYLGEFLIIMQNIGMNIELIRKGDRICQGVLAPVLKAEFREVSEFDKVTERNTKGGGSTGV